MESPKPNPLSNSASNPPLSLFERFSNSVFLDAVVLAAGAALPWIASCFSSSTASLCNDNPISVTVASASLIYLLFRVYIFSQKPTEEPDSEPDSPPEIPDFKPVPFKQLESELNLKIAFEVYAKKLEKTGLSQGDDIDTRYSDLHKSEKVKEARNKYKAAATSNAGHAERGVKAPAPTGNPVVNAAGLKDSLDAARAAYLEALLTALRERHSA
jgi:hypothetical protein